MRYVLVILLMVFGMVSPAAAQLSISFGTPNLSIGINVPVYPNFVQVPGYPVYYASNLSTNYFFYDDSYWIFNDDRWYVSSGYNGPWSYVNPYNVPRFILRIPVRYYRHPPRYFYGWRRDEPPHWGRRWGHDWRRRGAGWDNRHRRRGPRGVLPPRYWQHPGGNYRHNDNAQYNRLQRLHYGYPSRDARLRQRHQVHDRYRIQGDNRSHDRGGWGGSGSGPRRGNW